MKEDLNYNGRQEYSAEDLQRYLAGEMTGAEMHALEKASSEDPLLGDALEGMRATKSDTRNDIAMLRRRLTERSAEKNRVVPFWRSGTAVAAAVVLLIGLGSLGLYLKRGPVTTKDLALTEKKTTALPPASEPAVPAAETAAPAASGTDTVNVLNKQSGNSDLPARDRNAPPGSGMAAAPAAQRAVDKKKDLDRETEKQLKKEDEAFPKEQEVQPVADERQQPEMAVAKKRTAVPDSVPDDFSAPAAASDLSKAGAVLPAQPPAGMVKNRALLKTGSPQTAMKNPVSFSGKVVDAGGSPLPGVMIQMGKTRTTTDAQGKFMLSAPRTGNLPLDFSSAGYQTLLLIPDTAHPENLYVKLSPAPAALGEVVVTGYATAKPAASPRPATGWKQYHNYLGSNKNPSGIDSSLHGTEKISFSITRNGEPVDFAIDESISPVHDSLAVRIIRDGPKWKPAGDSTRRISLALPY